MTEFNQEFIKYYFRKLKNKSFKCIIYKEERIYNIKH